MNKLHAFQLPIFQSDKKCNNASSQISRIPPRAASCKPQRARARRTAAGEASRRDSRRRNTGIHSQALMDRVVKKGFQVLPTVSYLCLHPDFNILIRRTERERDIWRWSNKKPRQNNISNDSSNTHCRVKTWHLVLDVFAFGWHKNKFHPNQGYFYILLTGTNYLDIRFMQVETWQNTHPAMVFTCSPLCSCLSLSILETCTIKTQGICTGACASNWAGKASLC